MQSHCDFLKKSTWHIQRHMNFFFAFEILKLLSLGFKNSLFSITCDEHGMADEFIFVSVQYFIGAILSKKSCQKRGVWKRDGMAIWIVCL